jgi:hypothetical protein
MNRIGALVIAAVVLVIVAIGGLLILRNSGSSAAGPRTLSVTVTGTTMSPNQLAATQNQQITLQVTADRKEEIHLHGYDIHFEVGGAGQTVTHSFKADKTGSFEIEIENTSTHLGQFQVTP